MTDTASSPVEIRGISRDKAPEPELGTDPIILGHRYTSPEFAQREWDHMWTRVWQVAGRVDQIPEAGDYVNYEIGHESIIAVRGDDGKIRAFYNVCQHRGNQLVNAEVGTLAGGEFQCAYHGWRFDTTGECTWVYDEDDFPQGTPCGNRNLAEIPCDTWGGFIWFNMDPGAAPLRDWLSPVADQLDGYRMENMKRTHWVTVVGDWNWKCVQDNFNESYHLPFVHPQTVASMNEHHSGCQFDLYPSGHARMLMPGGGPGPQYRGRADRTFQSLKQDFEFWEFDPEPYRDNLLGLRVALQQRKRELGASKGYDFSSYSDEQLTDHYHYTVFPNVSFSMKPDGCIWLRSAPAPDRSQQVHLRHVVPDAVPRGRHRVLLQLDARLGLDRPPGRAPDRPSRRGLLWPRHRPGRRHLDHPAQGPAFPRLPRRVPAHPGASDPLLPREHRQVPGHASSIRIAVWARGWSLELPSPLVSDEYELGSTADLEGLADGKMQVFEDAGDYGLVVCRVNGELYALEDNCSHADTPLSEGRLRGTNLTCPLHGTSFDVRTGEHSGPPAYTGVPCYRVEDRDGTVVAIRAGDDGDDNDGFGNVGGMFRTR